MSKYLTAETARKIAAENADEWKQELSDKISAASRKGKCQVDVFGLSHEKQSHLEKLGFRIKSTPVHKYSTIYWN